MVNNFVNRHKFKKFSVAIVLFLSGINVNRSISIKNENFLNQDSKNI